MTYVHGQVVDPEEFKNLGENAIVRNGYGYLIDAFESHGAQPPYTLEWCEGMDCPSFPKVEDPKDSALQPGIIIEQRT